MYDDSMRRLLEQVRDGSVTPEQAEQNLRALPFEDLGYAKVDHHRQMRTGHPEVVYCAGKTTEHALGVFAALLRREGTSNILGTRADRALYEQVRALDARAVYHEMARIIEIPRAPKAAPKDGVLVVTAGTSDIKVAEEAAVTAESMGHGVARVYDVGVAGIHRLLAHTRDIQKANVVIAVAGMEGALASVVGGLADAPVIAVPTSVGYGANFGGLSALLTMINSCSSGISVVNIDNGFGAGYLAAMINDLAHRRGEDA
nr:nickel pincer cofactor biosynthesis protein LarB [Maliibacterium massiliense]